MKLAQGHQIITYPLFILFFLSVLLAFWSSVVWWITIVIFILLIFVIQFFRDPERFPDQNYDEIVVSPADGVLFEIDTQSIPEVTIFRIRMRFWDVHVNRMPLDGKLTSKSYKKGSYLPIIPGVNRYSKSRNARQELVFDHPSGFEFKVVQISGILAYRCVAYHEVSDRLIKRGERLGMIRFGSETDLHVPSDRIKITAFKGQKVKGGKTVLGVLTNK